MNKAYTTIGHLKNKNTLILEDKLPEYFDDYKVTLKPIKKKSIKRIAGFAKGKIIIKNNFNDPLEEFKEYIE